MKPPILMTRKGSHLVPADPWASEAVAELPPETLFNVRLSRAVSQGTKRAGVNALYWAGLDLMVKNFNEEDEKCWPTKRKLHELIMAELGYVTKRWARDRTFIEEVDSVAYDNMEDEDFYTYVEKARAFLVVNFGYDPLQLWLDNKELWEGRQ